MVFEVRADVFACVQLLSERDVKILQIARLLKRGQRQICNECKVRYRAGTQAVRPGLGLPVEGFIHERQLMLHAMNAVAFHWSGMG